MASASPCRSWRGSVGWPAQEPRFAGLVLAVGGVGLIGLIDDLRDLAWPPRLATHCLAAVLALWSLAPDWPLAIVAVALVLAVWHINLFNFMDGIDGLAGSACLFFCLAVHSLSGGAPGWLGGLLWVTAGGALGFLTFNWPPARIFMGDVGSLFLGLLLAAATVGLIDQGILSAAACLILLTGLWFDTTYTLCVRILTHQRFTHAHRSHPLPKGRGAARATMDNSGLLGILPAVAAAAGMARANPARLRLALAAGRRPPIGGGRPALADRASRPRAAGRQLINEMTP